MFSYLSPEQGVPKDHPLRAIRVIVDRSLAELDGHFNQIYSDLGRPSIPPEHLLRALLLQAFYSIRSDRQLMEQLDHNLLFRSWGWPDGSTVPRIQKMAGENCKNGKNRPDRGAHSSIFDQIGHRYSVFADFFLRALNSSRRCFSASANMAWSGSIMEPTVPLKTQASSIASSGIPLTLSITGCTKCLRIRPWNRWCGDLKAPSSLFFLYFSLFETISWILGRLPCQKGQTSCCRPGPSCPWRSGLGLTNGADLLATPLGDGGKDMLYLRTDLGDAPIPSLLPGRKGLARQALPSQNSEKPTRGWRLDQ